MGKLEVSLQLRKAQINDLIKLWSRTGEQGNRWRNASIDIGYNGGEYQVRDFIYCRRGKGHNRMRGNVTGYLFGLNPLPPNACFTPSPKMGELMNWRF